MIYRDEALRGTRQDLSSFNDPNDPTTDYVGGEWFYSLFSYAGSRLVFVDFFCLQVRKH